MGNKSLAQSTQLTMLLNRWRTDDPNLIGDIIPAVYDELHLVANSLMRRQPQGHTLQATALINEAFMRLDNVDSELKDRGHFIGIVGRLMRLVLIDHARSKMALKRGGDQVDLSLEDNDAVVPAISIDVLALEEVLTQLGESDPRKIQIAELHYFCGMTQQETAEALELSESTVRRELRMLKAVLARQLAAT